MNNQEYNAAIMDLRGSLVKKMMAVVNDAKKNRRLQNKINGIILKRMQDESNPLTTAELFATYKAIVEADRANLESFVEIVKSLNWCDNEVSDVPDAD